MKDMKEDAGIEKSKTISSKKQSSFSKENYFKSKFEMTSLFQDLPEAIQNTTIIAQKCSFCLKSKKLSLPKFVNSNLSDEFTVLKQISVDGLEKRLKENKIFQDLDKVKIYKIYKIKLFIKLHELFFFFGRCL